MCLTRGDDVDAATSKGVRHRCQHLPATVSRARRTVSNDESVHRDGPPGRHDQWVDVDLGDLSRQRRAQHRESGHRPSQRVDVGARFPPSAV